MRCIKNQRNKESRKVAILANREIQIAPKLFFLSFDKSINNELTKGKKINVDNIGKFILF
mgnify:CR=1 FL=1